MSISFHPLNPQTHLAGPPPISEGSNGSSVGAVTGGKLVAIVERLRGIRSLWRGREALLREGLELSLGTSILSGDHLRFGPGSWERRLPLPSGAFLVERGLIPDVGGALVVQWSLVSPVDPPPTNDLSESSEFTFRLAGTSDDGARFALSLASPSPATLLILPERETLARVGQLLSPLRSRELQRSNRSRLADPRSLRIMVDGVMVQGVVESLNALDESGLPMGEEEAGILILGGVEDGAPRFLEGSHLAEVGVAALHTGRRSLARSALSVLATEADPPGLPLLHLAEQWAHWTGDPRVLDPFRPALDRAVSSLDRTFASAALPQPARILREMINAVEPLGDEGWNRFLGDHLKRIETPLSPLRGRALPVLGASAAGEGTVALSPEDSGGAENEPDLPDPYLFASPDHPAVLARRTVQGARILRGWIGGVLGVRPDAGYGRVRIAPVIRPSWWSFEARGISAGDSLFSVHFRREEEGCNFTLSQEGGKVPINLIFEPLLPFEKVSAVSIDGAPAEVEIEIEDGGIRLRCQLPLDGERQIRIEGAISGISSSPF